MTTPESIDLFIARWQSAGGSERANYQLFITELCELLELPKPEPAQADARDNALSTTPQSEAELASRFTGKGKWKSRLPELLATLATLGRARQLEDGRWLG